MVVNMSEERDKTMEWIKIEEGKEVPLNTYVLFAGNRTWQESDSFYYIGHFFSGKDFRGKDYKGARILCPERVGDEDYQSFDIKDLYGVYYAVITPPTKGKDD
jgi:hypothetical protein